MNIKAGAFKLKGDRIIWIVFSLLCIISIVEVFSAIGNYVYANNVNPYKILVKHIILLCFGFVVTYTFQNIRYTIIPHFLNLAMIVSAVCLIIAIIVGLYCEHYLHFKSSAPICSGRWIAFPFKDPKVRFQPIEMAKYITIMWIAMKTALMNDKIKKLEVYKKILYPVLIIIMIILASNASSAIILFVAAIILLFIAGAKVKHIFTTCVILLGVLIIMLLAVKAFPPLGNVPPMTRIATMNTRIQGNKTGDKTHQTARATMAIGNAGILGLGPGNSKIANFQKQAHDDFLYMVIVEEGGFLLGLFVMLLYLVIVYRCFLIAKHAKGLFGAFTAMGVGLVFVIQALVHMAVSVGFAEGPVTGQTLPLISRGGSSQLFVCFALGVVLNISSTCEKDSTYDNDLTENTNSEISGENQIEKEGKQ